LKKRLSDLEVSWDGLARDEEEERRLSTRSFLTTRIVAEHAWLRASGDLVEKACLAVAHDQHDILGPEHCDNIGRA
jgi:hypothetical protein